MRVTIEMCAYERPKGNKRVCAFYKITLQAHLLGRYGPPWETCVNKIVKDVPVRVVDESICGECKCFEKTATAKPGGGG